MYKQCLLKSQKVYIFRISDGVEAALKYPKYFLIPRAVASFPHWMGPIYFQGEHQRNGWKLSHFFITNRNV